MTVTFTGLGILNIVFASSPTLQATLIRRIVWINLPRVVAFTALNANYRIPRRLISEIVIALPLIAALLVPNRAELSKSA